MSRLLLALALVALVAAPAQAASVSSTDLDREPESWDGRQVVLRGELVGDYGIRDDGVWVQLNDDPYATAPLAAGGGRRGVNTGVGVWIPRHLFSPDWGSPGRYLLRGPIVEVRGVFRHRDPDRIGETYVEARGVELIAPSRRIDPEAEILPWTMGVVALACGALLGLAARRRRVRLGLL